MAASPVCGPIDAGTVSVPAGRGKDWTLRVIYTVREFDPDTPEGEAKMGRIHRALHGGKTPEQLLAQVRRLSKRRKSA